MAALSRRVFLGCLPAAAAAENALIRSELKRFRDPSTEFELLRYTEPAYSSYLVPAELRSVGAKGNFVLICSDRSDANQVYRLDTKSGEMRVLTNVEGVRATGIALLPDDRTFYCVHGSRVDLFPVGNGRPKLLYEAEEGWTPGALGLHDDGRLVLVEQNEAKWAVRLLGIERRAETLFEADAAIDLIRPRPRGNSLLYRKAGRLWLYDYAARTDREVRTDPVTAPCFYWSADGASLFYLCVPEGGRGVQLREHIPDSGEDKLISPTSQFVNFAANRNASVFVGVSGSKVSPYLLLLLRVTCRELALADHRSVSASDVVVFFTPDSRRIFFHGNRSGKSCVYGFNAEKLVEPTDT